MKQTFVCRALVFASFLALAGCAQDGGSRPSYLGLAALAAPEMDATVEGGSKGLPSNATRYVQSNKVLGAMAFQRVTGRTVDPSRLSESR